jgi:hypothetical protein
MTGSIVVPRSGERVSATPLVFAHAAVATDTDNCVTSPELAAPLEGRDDFNVMRQVDGLLFFLAVTSLVGIAGYALAIVAIG